MPCVKTLTIAGLITIKGSGFSRALKDITWVSLGQLFHRFSAFVFLGMLTLFMEEQATLVRTRALIINYFFN